ncbi:MAG: GDP-mannose 4,6-dehydratase, partial [uncultured Solirubrobacteraceae bacterium]
GNEARTDHGHHRPGRVLPRRAPARRGLRGPRHGPPGLHGEVRADRAPARPHHAPSGRPARPALPRRRPPRERSGRDLQPRGDVLRGGLLGPAHAHRRVHRHRRHPHARGDARGLPRGPLLPGLELGDVRQGPRGPPDRGHPVLPALALRRGEGLRALHHRQLPRVLRPARHERDPLQPREPPPRPGVRHPQDHLARRGDPPRQTRQALPRQPRRRARLGLREGLRPRDVAHAPAGPRGGLRHRHEPDEHRPRVRPGRLRRGRPGELGAARRDRPPVRAPGRGRPAHRLLRQGRARPGLAARDDVRGAHPAYDAGGSGVAAAV